MEVEVFEDREIMDGGQSVEETDREAIALVEKLGLGGQRNLMNPQEGTRCPFREMTQAETFAYGTLCPNRATLGDYQASSIPLRVLQTALLVQELRTFKLIRVWYSGGVEKDPILVAHRDHEYQPAFLLARWGEHLAPLPDLIRMAFAMWKQKQLVSLAQMQQRIANEITILRDLAEPTAEIIGGHTPSFSGVFER